MPFSAEQPISSLEGCFSRPRSLYKTSLLLRFRPWDLLLPARRNRFQTGARTSGIHLRRVEAAPAPARGLADHHGRLFLFAGGGGPTAWGRGRGRRRGRRVGWVTVTRPRFLAVLAYRQLLASGTGILTWLEMFWGTDAVGGSLASYWCLWFCYHSLRNCSRLCAKHACSLSGEQV